MYEHVLKIHFSIDVSKERTSQAAHVTCKSCTRLYICVWTFFSANFAQVAFFVNIWIHSTISRTTNTLNLITQFLSGAQPLTARTLPPQASLSFFLPLFLSLFPPPLLPPDQRQNRTGRRPEKSLCAPPYCSRALSLSLGRVSCESLWLRLRTCEPRWPCFRVHPSVRECSKVTPCLCSCDRSVGLTAASFTWQVSGSCSAGGCFRFASDCCNWLRWLLLGFRCGAVCLVVFRGQHRCSVLDYADARESGVPEKTAGDWFC